MTTAFLLRRLLACWVAICVAASGIMPQCEAASPASRPCCCGCPGECKCGHACTCLTPRPAPAKSDGTEKADPREKPEPSVPGTTTATATSRFASDLSSRALRPSTTLTRFPSLRTLEVRIQT